MGRKKKPPTVPVYMRLRKSLKEGMDKLAERHRRPITMEFEIAIEEYIERNELEPPPNGHRPSK